MDRTVLVKTNNLPISPRKLRLVAALVRGKNLVESLDMLQFVNKKGADMVRKSLTSAAANAEVKYGWSKERLVVKSVSVDEAPVLKRGRFASRARAVRILKRRSNLNLEVVAK